LVANSPEYLDLFRIGTDGRGRVVERPMHPDIGAGEKRTPRFCIRTYGYHVCKFFADYIIQALGRMPAHVIPNLSHDPHGERMDG
jgi:hypothetical protein